MKLKTGCLLLSLLYILPLSTIGQITNDTLRIKDELTDDQLVRQVFLKGFCKNVKNIYTIGEEFSVGEFYNAKEIIGIDAGVIISTGDIALAEGPNTSSRVTETQGKFGDDDLGKIATAGVFDPSGIVFEFVPLTDRVSFTYVFASEEYCEFVGSAFNDVFGFFVSGPGIDGEFSNNAINVAKIPGSDEFVSINTVNHESNPDIYIKNEIQEDAEACGIDYLPNFLSNIEYDGFTLPLKAEFDVIPCETYKIRLVVADVQDQILDSAVFLEMNSFDIGGNIKLSASSESSEEPIASEGCTDGLFTFTRLASESGMDETINYFVHPSSTADAGQDLEMIPFSIRFPAGETEVTLPISIIEDNIDENQETFGLALDLPCECFDVEEATLYINDDLYFFAEFEDIDACPDEEFSFGPLVTGGAPPYSYEWSTNDIIDSISTSIGQTTSYDVIVRDICGRETNASTIIDIKQAPNASLNGTYRICQGKSEVIEVTLGGQGPWDLAYQVDAEPPSYVFGITTTPYQINADQAGVYQITEFNDRTCKGVSNGQAVVEQELIDVMTTMIDPTCPNSFDGAIQLDVMTDNPPVTIQWTPQVNDPYNPSNLLQGAYGLEITDAKGCKYKEIISLSSPAANKEECAKLNIYIPNVFTPNDDGDNDTFLIFLDSEPSIQEVRSFDIFDRWGNRVFQKQNFSPKISDIGFDGIHQSLKLSPGVYSYTMSLSLDNNINQTVSGSITLIR